MHYYNARYYNPEIRRFTQPDDIIQDAYDPQSLNRYSYVRNNPIRYTDPSGHNFIINAIMGYIVKHTINVVFAPKPAAQPQKNQSSGNTQNIQTNKSNTNNNAKSSGAKSSGNNITPPQAPPGTDASGNVQDAYNNRFNPLYFPSKVREGGKWDYKRIGSQYEDFGNFNYGLTGRASGYSERQLLIMAGIVQQATNLWAILDPNKEPVRTGGIPGIVDPNGDASINGTLFGGYSNDQFRIQQGANYYYLYY